MSTFEERGEIIRDAIQQAIGDNAMVTDYICLANYIDDNGRTSWTWAVAPGQTILPTLGLTEMASKIAQRDMDRHLDDPAGDDQ